MTVTLRDVRAALAHPASPPELGNARRASVALLIEPDLSVLFMLRAQREGDPWSGQVSLPGGHRDPTDASDLHAALRETHEELGIEVHPEQLLGPLTPVATRRRHLPRRNILPFVFALDKPATVRPNHEVASVHRVRLPDLLAGRGRSTFTFPYDDNTLTLPQVHFDGVMLWGLTLQIVDDLLHRIDRNGVGLARPVETP